MKECGGNFTILKNGVKDCSECLLPHYDYDYVIEKLMRQADKNK
jgi:Zn-finger protein